MEEAKYATLATDTEVNNYFSIYKNSEIIDPKMMIFNSLIAADDYNFGAHVTPAAVTFPFP